MSAILAIHHLDGMPVEEGLADKLAKFMAFEGSGDVGVWRDGSITLACAGFYPVTDVKDRKQPFTLDNEVYIVANARVDGRDELIKRLRSSGRVVPMDCADHELILHTYHAWGRSSLEHLIGDFAFVIWDGRMRRIFCAIDQFGVRQLYFSQIENRLILCNSLPCLLRYPGVSGTLNETAIGDYLLFGINCDRGTTAYADIARMPPGNTLTAANGKIMLNQYWTLPEDYGRRYIYCKPVEYVEDFLRLFDQAVADRLRTDRAALHLSGGLDSGSIAVSASRLSERDSKPCELRAYTIIYNKIIPDAEGHFAALTAKAADIPVEYMVAEDFISNAPEPEPSWIPPQPLLMPFNIAETEINRRAASFCRVLLVGFGGDPAFSRDFEPEWRVPDFGRGYMALVDDLLENLFPKIRVLFSGKLGRGNGRTNEKGFVSHFPDWLNSDFARRERLEERWKDHLMQPPRKGIRGMFTAPLWSNFFMASEPGFLSLPLEVRYPFFDKRLIDFLAMVPTRRWRRRKKLLRVAMRDRLPDQVRSRPKVPLLGNPHFVLFEKKGVAKWMKDMINRSEMMPFVNANRWLESIEKPGYSLSMDWYYTQNALKVAYWLSRGYKHDEVTHTTTGEG